MDGSIFLDFSGVGPEASMKPGTVIIYDKSGNVSSKKELKLVSGEHWEEFIGLKNEMSRPHLGANLYAANREKPPIPWKPDTTESQDIEKERN